MLSVGVEHQRLTLKMLWGLGPNTSFYIKLIGAAGALPKKWRKFSSTCLYATLQLVIPFVPDLDVLTGEIGLPWLVQGSVKGGLRAVAPELFGNMHYKVHRNCLLSEAFHGAGISDDTFKAFVALSTILGPIFLITSVSFNKALPLNRNNQTRLLFSLPIKFTLELLAKYKCASANL